MEYDGKHRVRLRTVAMIGGCLAAATIAIPSIATAGVKAVQEVIVTNAITEPVPVAPQGPTEVTGTVTVSGQPLPLQIQLEPAGVTRENPSSSETLYTVPEGKLLTVEWAELTFWRLLDNTDAQRLSLFVSCTGADRRDGPIDSITRHLPEIEGGNEDRTFGGPLKLLVPGGHCLRSNVVLDRSGIPENATLFINGAITGYLSDLPPASE